MQFRTKLGLVDIPNDEVMAASRDIASSAEAPCEIAGTVSSLGLARGWVPVSSAEVSDVVAQLESLADHHAHSARVGSVTRDTPRTRETARKAIVLRHCAEVLRRQMEAATVRQPAPNRAHDPTAERTK